MGRRPPGCWVTVRRGKTELGERGVPHRGPSSDVELANCSSTTAAPPTAAADASARGASPESPLTCSNGGWLTVLDGPLHGIAACPSSAR